MNTNIPWGNNVVVMFFFFNGSGAFAIPDPGYGVAQKKDRKK